MVNGTRFLTIPTLITAGSRAFNHIPGPASAGTWDNGSRDFHLAEVEDGGGTLAW